MAFQLASYIPYLIHYLPAPLLFIPVYREQNRKVVEYTTSIRIFLPELRPPFQWLA